MTHSQKLLQPDDRTAAHKMLDMVEALAAYPVTGISNSSLAKHLGCPPSWVTINMATLITKGWARKDEGNGLFYPTPAMGRVFGRVMADISAAEQRLADIKHNFAGALR
jgi:DNA-binding IclR family transcriptional regulator